MNLYDKIFKPKTMRLANGKTVEERASRLPVILLALVAASVLSVKVTGFNLSTLVTRGNQFFVILGQMFPPNASYLSSIWTPLFDTIKMSLLGSFIGSALAIPFAIVASTNIIHNRAVIGVVRVFLSLVRTLPTLVTALIATYMFGLGTMAGTFAIAVFTFAYVGKQLYEQMKPWIWAPMRPWKPWAPPNPGPSYRRFCPRCCPYTCPFACSALKGTCATPPFWGMWAQADWA